MSSRRRLRHAPPVKRYSRRDIWLAIGAGTAVVLATLFAIWMLRPGGIADRQPRATWLVVLSVLAVGAYAWWLLGPRAGRREPLVGWLAGGVAVITVGAVLAGFLWPGGLLRHSPDALDISDFEVPDELPDDLVDPDGVPGDTTEPGTDTTGPATDTSAPPGTEPTETTDP